MMITSRSFAGIVFVVAVHGGCADSADVVLTGGVVWTGTGATATAVAMKDGNILAVGNDAEVGRLATSRTEWIDLAGRLVVPGLMDNHTHFLDGGFALGDIDGDGWPEDVTSNATHICALSGRDGTEVW